MTFNDGYRPYFEPEETESYTGHECPKCLHMSLDFSTKTDFCTNPNCDYTEGYW